MHSIIILNNLSWTEALVERAILILISPLRGTSTLFGTLLCLFSFLNSKKSFNSCTEIFQSLRGNLLKFVKVYNIAASRPICIAYSCWKISRVLWRLASFRRWIPLLNQQLDVIILVLWINNWIYCHEFDRFLSFQSLIDLDHFRSKYNWISQIIRLKFISQQHISIDLLDTKRLQNCKHRKKIYESLKVSHKKTKYSNNELVLGIQGPPILILISF